MAICNGVFLQQGGIERLLAQSQLTCLAKIPSNRQAVTFTTKRRRFKPCHKEDVVSPDMALVYENNMHRYYFWGQLIMNTLAVPIYGMSFYILVSTWHLQVDIFADMAASVCQCTQTSSHLFWTSMKNHVDLLLSIIYK